jgi:DNA-binding transcriptional ArsR family regulator
MSRSIKNPTQAKSLAKATGSGSCCQEMAETLKALSHPVRLKVLLLLAHGPKSISELHAGCESCSQSQMSQFVSRMALEGLISSTRDGRKKMVQIADARVKQAIHALVKIYAP